jgi:hypothetical protein
MIFSATMLFARCCPVQAISTNLAMLRQKG